MKPNEFFNLEFLIKKINIFEKEETENLTFEIFLMFPLFFYHIFYQIFLNISIVFFRIENVPFMYEINIPLFATIFFKFHNIKSKTFDYLNDKYSFQFMKLSYLKNQEIISFDEIPRIFPELIGKEVDFVSDEDYKVLGVFSFAYMNKTVRLMILIQEGNKYIDFHLKMKQKTQKDFYDTILDKKEIIEDLKINIIEEIFASFIII